MLLLPRVTWEVQNFLSACVLGHKGVLNLYSVTFAADPGSGLPELDSALSQNPGMHEPPLADPASSPEHGEVASEPSLVLGLAPQLATGFSGDIQL